jgi:hypothetical protein
MFYTIIWLLIPFLLQERCKKLLRKEIIFGSINYPGYDNRYPENYTDILEMSRIHSLFEKKQWLYILSNNYISTYEKLKLVEFILIENKTSNLFNGLDLENEWN